MDSKINNTYPLTEHIKASFLTFSAILSDDEMTSKSHLSPLRLQQAPGQLSTRPHLWFLGHKLWQESRWLSCPISSTVPHTHTHASTHIDAPQETHKICWPPDLLASSDSTICLVPDSGRSVEKRKREERKDRKWKTNGGHEKQRKRKRAWLEWAQAKRGREMGKEAEEESNLLKGLKVWVGLTHHPLAKMNAHVSSSCVCRDERWTRFQHRPQGGVKKSEIVKYSVETWQHDTAVELPCCMVSPQTFNGRLLACPPYRTLSSLR